jgi:hypothetical protein
MAVSKTRLAIERLELVKSSLQHDSRFHFGIIIPYLSEIFKHFCPQDSLYTSCSPFEGCGQLILTIF